MAFTVDEEFSEIPDDITAREIAALASHELVHWVAAWTVDLDLLEEWESDFVLGDELLNLSWALWLLLTELVAWNCVDLQALVLVLVVNGFQLLVVAISQTSVGCDVHEKNGLLTGSMLSDSAQTVAINVINCIS